MPFRFFTRGKGKIWQVEGSEKTPWGTVTLRASTGQTRKSSAEEWLRTAVHIETERLKTPRAEAITVAEVASHYMDHLADKEAVRQKEDPDWSSPDLSYLKPIISKFGDVKVADLTPEMVADFERETYGHKVADTRKRELYTPLNAMLAHCGPDNLKLCQHLHFNPPAVGKRMVVDYATRDWLLTLAQDSNQRIVTAVLFLASTGARVTEMCRVRRSAVDWKSGDVTLRMTKNGKPRLVTVAPALLEMMRRGLDDRTEDGKESADDVVFGYAARWSVNQALERACARRKIKYLSSHKCGRHAFAAMLLGSRQTLQAVMVAGGWSGIGVVSETYGHLERGMAQDMHLTLSTSLVGHTNRTQALETSIVVTDVEKEKTPGLPGFEVVGATGIEPVTPTMSRLLPSPKKVDENPDK